MRVVEGTGGRQGGAGRERVADGTWSGELIAGERDTMSPREGPQKVIDRWGGQ